MKYSHLIFISLIIISNCLYGQFENTYINPVIPGDHPDPTLTKIGNDFYSSGSSFNPTPKIYHSTDLVHWEVIAQPVSAAWSGYGNSPGGGIWGGHMVLYNGKYWHYFGRGGGAMYFTTADQPEGPWSEPTQVNSPAGMGGLGVDNSIFIDDDNKWYMLTKAGQQNNHIIELGDNGQPTGKILDLTWLNPDVDGNPYGWAEGPVMWKHNGYYYYSFAQHLVGSQYVMRSAVLTDNKEDWTIIGTNIFTGTTSTFRTPNHIGPAIELDDGTSWIIAHSYHSDYYAQGRQGLLCEVVYDSDDFPKILRPQTSATSAPNLPNSGIPWMVAHSDNFDSDVLNPEWSFLGYTANSSWSLSERPGWLRLSTGRRGATYSLLKNDGEHSYSLITKLEYDPEDRLDEAGLLIINGPQTHRVKVVNALNDTGANVFKFSLKDTKYEIENTIGNTFWLKLVREEHYMSAYYSPNGFDWNRIGEQIYAYDIDIEQASYNSFTGNQQGLYVYGKEAFFDCYVYRDAYTPIYAANPANKNGTSGLVSSKPPFTLSSIKNDDWTMYAGVEFGNDNYIKSADSVFVTASTPNIGGKIQVVLDSINSADIVAEIEITATGAWNQFETFRAPLVRKVTGNHDVYLIFKGDDSGNLFNLQTITFKTNDTPTSVNDNKSSTLIDNYKLYQNYPNPFNPVTNIKFSIVNSSKVSLKVYDILGNEVAELFNGLAISGEHTVRFNGTNLSSGVYFYKLETGNFQDTKKLLLLK